MRAGAVGGYDTAAPGHREDGLALGLGYRYDALTLELDYAYLDYDGSAGIGGNTQRFGLLGQARVIQPRCEANEICPHYDLDLGIGKRWVNWTPVGILGSAGSTVQRQGNELLIGASANFLLHLSLHYVFFQPDDAPAIGISCRGSCPMRTTGNDHGLLFEASFAFGG